MNDNTNLSRRAIISTGLSLCALAGANGAWAQGKNTVQQYVAAPKFNPDDRLRIKAATSYLQTLSAGTGRFQQTDYRGKITVGNWFLQRPGKMRFEYDAPFSLLVVADGKWVNIWDPRLKSFDKYPQGETPLSLFLSKQIRFDQGVIITQVALNSDGFRLKARDRRKDVEGYILIDFAQLANGLRLKGWNVVDAQNRSTEVKLISFETNQSLKPSLFVLNSAPK